MKYWACYIALDFSISEKEDIYHLCITQLAEYPIAFFEPPYYHLTLYYLGWLDKQSIPVLKKILASYYNISPKWIFQTSGKLISIGYENDLYLALQIEPSNELTSVYQDLGNKLVSNDISFKKQEFNPHISIGRLRKSIQSDLSIPLERKHLEANHINLQASHPSSIVLATNQNHE